MIDSDHTLTRRDFVKKGTAGLAATAAAANLGLVGSMAYAQGDDKPLRLGIIGCGGRGSGAVNNCLQAAEELGLPLKLVAMADLQQEVLDGSANVLSTAWQDKGRFAVPVGNRFVGLDCYKALCAHPDVDIVIHTTPPGLRYLTLRAAVENGKHSFVEKPVCVDADTYHHVIASGAIAEEKGLSIVSGTQYRREFSYRDAITQMNDGLIGQVTSSYAYYCTNVPTPYGQGDPADLAYQMRYWHYFGWLSGDLIAEQSIHNIDAINWQQGGVPRSCYASGGLAARSPDSVGNVYDHFDVHFDYPSGMRCSFMGRQYSGATSRVSNRWVGTKGTLDLTPNPGRTAWRARGHDGTVLAMNRGRSGNNQPYVEEHKEMLNGIVNNELIMEIQEVADSSLTCILGREAAYSGKELSFQWLAEQATLKLRPERIDQGLTPGAVQMPFPGVRMPGAYRTT